MKLIYVTLASTIICDENINGGYFCNCDSGWEGKTCSDDFNECIHFGSSEWSLKQRVPFHQEDPFT